MRYLPPSPSNSDVIQSTHIVATLSRPTSANRPSQQCQSQWCMHVVVVYSVWTCVYITEKYISQLSSCFILVLCPLPGMPLLEVRYYSNLSIFLLIFLKCNCFFSWSEVSTVCCSTSDHYWSFPKMWLCGECFRCKWVSDQHLCLSSPQLFYVPRQIIHWMYVNVTMKASM